MPDWGPIDEFPVTDEHADAPDGARMFSDGKVIERHGTKWWVLGPETLKLRNIDGAYVVIADGQFIATVHRVRRPYRRTIRARWRARWRWRASNVRYLDYATRREAVEDAVLAYYESIDPQEGPTP